ncbi:hypothetical protein [Metabacillus rhizolycopersici]|uniref:Uncharacterized protein n=1 Tax=Metabacillus rhizolycopersici TaxID=2875709 RepID=A0ABS7UY63_9BACI|nr:hypothetical protein [Metabacillus rhizolycopersici]MBZ5753255.1 hypothetical protein [Metabacillus rhizolycopersici]
MSTRDNRAHLNIELAPKALKGEHIDKSIDDSGVDIVTKDNPKSGINFYAKEVFINKHMKFKGSILPKSFLVQIHSLFNSTGSVKV